MSFMHRIGASLVLASVLCVSALVGLHCAPATEPQVNYPDPKVEAIKVLSKFKPLIEVVKGLLP